ncbi:MAG: 30S ribosomal protein S8 [Candidatus Omnitrophica bacterium]|nr:30S ribosomal protein S8 [Candidatus Omnitrophota bacterium]MBD3268558.1 30S ribosomal protein S8 [Candidatus Omnitrophota bacterium]
MSRTDLISDAFTIIRNAAGAKKEDTYIPYSKLLLRVCEILKNEGYLQNFKEVDLGNYKKIKIYLKYIGKKNAIRKISKVSKPGRRVYLKRKDIFPVLNGYGLAIVSTSKGIITDIQAREKGVGGEIIGAIW